MKYNDNGEWKDIQIKVANAIQNEYGESNNDGYSQNYLNDKLVNVGTSVDSRSRVNVLHSNNLLKYPYTDTTKTTNGITFTDNKDGTITISGTATANASFSLLGNDTNQFEIEGNYLNGGVNNNIYIRVVNYTSSYTILGTSSGSETHIDKSTYKKGYIEIRVNNGTAITTPITIKPIMTKESYSGEWQPYITPSIYVDNDEIYSKGTTLYDGGTTGSDLSSPISFSDSLANYERIEIYYGTTRPYYISNFYSNYGQHTYFEPTLQFYYLNNTDSSFYIYITLLSIGNTSISLHSSRGSREVTISSSGAITNTKSTTSSTIKIYKVIGYK